MSEAPQPAEPESAALQKYLDSSRLFLKKVREFDYRKLFQDLLAFLSIIRTTAPTQSHTSSSRSPTSSRVPFNS